MPGATVLITGATGFVGSHVVEAFLASDCVVRAVVRPTSNTAHLESLGVEAVVAPLDDPQVMAGVLSGADVVVHLAALTRAANEAEFDRANAVMTRSLLDAARTSPSRPDRFVYLSSLAAVGPARVDRPVERDDPPQPLTAYGRSKLAGERVCAECTDLEVAVLRAPAVYGPRDRDVYHFFRLARYGVLPVPTGPDRWLQMVHVADLARGIVCAALAPRAHGVYHIAEPRAYTWREVCRHVAAAVERRAVEVPLPAALLSLAGAASGSIARLIGRPGIFDGDKAREMLAAAWLCETETARAELGFTAEIALPDGLRDTAQWYRAAGLL